MIGYVTSCVDKFKQELGNEFVWFTPEPEPEPEKEEEENEGEGEQVTPETGDGDGDAVEEDDSGMSAVGIVFLVLFIVAVIAAGIYGLYLYRKDR